MTAYKKHNPIELIAFSALYITIGLFGVSLVSIEGTSLTIVWLPAGFGAVMVIRFGRSGILAVLLSSFIVNASLYSGANHNNWLPGILMACSMDALQSFLVMYFYKKYQKNLLFPELNIHLIRAVSSIFLLPTLFTSWILLIIWNHFFGFLDGSIYSLLKNYLLIFIADTTGIFLVLSLFVAFPQWRDFQIFTKEKGLILLFSLALIPFLAILHQDFMYLSFVVLLLLTYLYHQQGVALGVFVLNAATILLVASGYLTFGGGKDSIQTYVHTISFVFSTGVVFYLMSILFTQTEEKAKLLMQQSKLATMGEMINAISHQWKQPLSATYFFVELIQEKLDSKNQKDDDINKLIEKIIVQVKQMDTTITDFRDFLKPTTKKADFKLNEVVNEVYHLNEAKFHFLNIKFQVYGNKEVIIYGNPNELKQALLNIYSNTCDAFEESKEQIKSIDVYIEEVRTKIILRICDNAGGISENLLPDKLFQSYVSTKADKGTGIGLYISKTIIENSFHGKIWAHNIDGGAEFVIELPMKKKV
ncbi:ATP-binding protein [Arcobacter sp.]|uniref:ATP-binding protein n=1 Tax=Arcobacter sp. TaxID=1872629 RepID=UPI003D0C311F